ncbi:Uncharacterized protein At1g66480 [Linum grandiflorum]
MNLYPSKLSIASRTVLVTNRNKFRLLPTLHSNSYFLYPMRDHINTPHPLKAKTKPYLKEPFQLYDSHYLISNPNCNMGNAIGCKGKKTKVMKVTGETFKLKTPARANDVVKDYPGHVLLDSDAVKHFGIRARPLDPGQELKPKKIYFLVEMPKFPDDDQRHRGARRVRSGIHVGAKDRLDFMMLSKRSVSDLGGVRPPVVVDGGEGGPMRVKVRLPRAQVERLVAESNGGGEVAEKIIDLYMGNSGELGGAGAGVGVSRRHVHWRPELVSIDESLKKNKGKVSFAGGEEEGQRGAYSGHL